MLMIKAIVRPQKADEVVSALLEAGFPSVSKMDIVGRGKQKGIQIGDSYYEFISKKLIFTVINDEDKDEVIKIIIRAAKTGTKGAFGDGKIFVLPVTETYTISTGKAQL